MQKFIFVVGGVMSGVGKGISVASIAKILQSKGFRVTAMKIDPYINVDAGTMNPTEHGEVFVTDDGDETDQDIGNYERFLGRDIYRMNYMTTGRVYQSVITRERNLEYGGKCVQVVPHIPEEIMQRIIIASEKNRAEFNIIEIGGTVGEYENIIFLETIRMLKLQRPEDVAIVLVSYLPVPSKIGEMKTKPTQHAARALNSAGLQTDFVLARAPVPLDSPRREKLSVFCGVRPEHVISAPDVDSIYEVPLNFEKEGFGNQILKYFGLKQRSKDLREWRGMVAAIKRADKPVKIGIVGKYFNTGDFVLTDSYISVIEAIKHACRVNKVKPELVWLSTKDIEEQGAAGALKGLDGVIVPQGWGKRGSEGKIAAIKYCREKRVPYFGLCYGMQMAVVEFARNVAKLKDAHSAEVNPKSPHPVIHIMPQQQEYLKKKQYGGTIRLGAWPCKLKKGTHIVKAYGGKEKISERHRHRYEFNNEYREKLEKKGLTICGTSPDGKLVEAIELADHPFFIGTQFHPEYKSRPLQPHPLFVEFVKVCARKK
ncbi:CTP synthase [Candidatus Falkowbacteria bacterium]|nr:CTP synthase [Candidatus Falkowbacteria bacterium]